MAERRLSEIQVEFLTCKICKLPFDRPKVLSCLHTFCKRCLVLHVQKNGVRGKDGANCVFCPLCTQVCDLPRSGIDGLKDNQLLRNLLDMVGSKSMQNCDLCRDEGDTRAATYCCIKCEEFLCDECAKMHKRTRLTREHLVVNIGSMIDLCRGLQGKEQSAKVNARLLAKFGRHGNSLSNPIAITVNKADDILVSNDDNTVSVFSLSGTCKKVLDQSSFYGAEKHSLPNKGVAVTPEGYVAVAMRKDLTPQLVHMGVVQSLAGREISILTAKVKHTADCQPHGIVVTPNNHIVVTDVGRNCVYVFDSELQMVKQFGKKGSKGRRQFKGPYFVAATPNSDIVVSDYGNHTVKVFDLKGKPKLVIGRMGKNEGEFMHPMGVCVDRYGNTFVADRDNHRVQMFDTRGFYVATILQVSCKDGNDIRPQDVTLTTYGHLAVLLRGIEGVEMAEIQVYQYGSSRAVIPGNAATAHPTVNTPEGAGSAPRRLTPLSATGGAALGATPDLLPPGHKVKPSDNAAVLAALYATTTGQRLPNHTDHSSQICTIL